jgi:hypothetical protein
MITKITKQEAKDITQRLVNKLANSIDDTDLNETTIRSQFINPFFKAFG